MIFHQTVIYCMMKDCLNLENETKDVDTMLKKRKETSPNAGTPTEERRWVLGDLFLRGGISEKEYKEILPAIDKKNRETLLLASIMCAVMFTGLLVACLYSSTIKDAVAYYCTMAAACVCLAILSATTVKKLSLIHI